MPDFRPFSLADSMQAATNAAAGTLQIRNMQGAMADKDLFRQTAMQAAQGAPAMPGGAVQTMPGPVGAPPAGEATQTMPSQPVDVSAVSAPVTPAQAAGQPNMPMSAAGASKNAQAIHQLFGVHTAGHKKDFDYNYFASLLEAQGRPDLAAGAYEMGQKKMGAKIGMQLQLMDFVGRAAPLVSDQSALDALNQSMQQIGLVGALPKQWTPQVQQQLMEIGGKSLQQLEYKLKVRKQDEDERHNRAKEAIDRDKAAKEAKSANAKKYDELKASGVPDQIAKSVAYGGMRMVQDPMGLGAVFIDELTGQQIGELKNGAWTPKAGTFSGPGGAARPPLENFFK